MLAMESEEKWLRNFKKGQKMCDKSFHKLKGKWAMVSMHLKVCKGWLTE